ncbi:hypothetical protein AB6A40_009885 [Gnathostoma spinigerum]|uniref:Uncharacterized protein n=1 Tax=Gnathostoma spinigerum TaxID=75299 RepID=A0ABD6EV06_9BILA
MLPDDGLVKDGSTAAPAIAFEPIARDSLMQAELPVEMKEVGSAGTPQVGLQPKQEPNETENAQAGDVIQNSSDKSSTSTPETSTSVVDSLSTDGSETGKKMKRSMYYYRKLKELNYLQLTRSIVTSKHIRCSFTKEYLCYVSS